MHFGCIRTFDGTLFKHKASEKTFTYQRIAKGKFSLCPRLLEAGKQAGNASMVYESDRFFQRDPFRPSYDNPVYPEGAYGLRSIWVSVPYRNSSLGALLMYIITGEVQANGGKHLYLLRPTAKALGFYIQFGFHPDPDVAAGRRRFRLGHIKNSDHPEAEFAEKILMSRDYLIWRGSVEIILIFLTKKVTSVFDFDRPS